MKLKQIHKKYNYLFFVFTICTSFVFAQTSEIADKQNIIKSDLIFNILGHYNLKYERFVAKQQSIQLEVSRTNNLEISFFDLFSFKVDGYGGGMSYRYYLNDQKVLNGWYVSPRFRYHSFTFKDFDEDFLGLNLEESNDDNDTEDITILRSDVLLGYQIKGNYLAFDAFLGPQYLYASSEDDKLGAFYVSIGCILGFPF